MDDVTRKMMWSQFSASIDMLVNAMRDCPDDLWGDMSTRTPFWHVAYHTLFFLDLYLAESVDAYRPPPPFTLSELDPDGVLPDRVYTKEELFQFLEHGRRGCRSFIAELGTEDDRRECNFEWLDISVTELVLYNMRHVQHHAAQLNLLLRQNTDSAPGWVKRGGADRSH